MKLSSIISIVLTVYISLHTAIVVAEKNKPNHLYDYRWTLPSSTSDFLSTLQVAEILKNYDVVFFGEMHNHPGNHLAQMSLFEELYRQNPELTLSMEQFERDTQAILDQYMDGKIGEEYMIDEARAWNHYKTTYRALVEFARAKELPVIAANAPTQMVVCIGRSGLEVLERYPEEQRTFIADEIDVSEGRYQQKFLAFMQKDSVHKASDGEASVKAIMLRQFAAQAARDDTMAESIARHIQAFPGRQVLHLNGSFHSSEFLGTPERLKKRLPDLRIAVIHPQTTDEETSINLDKPLATLLLHVLPIPKMFVEDSHRKEWSQSLMNKRMKSRKTCPE